MIKNAISNGSIRNTMIMVLLISVLFMLFPGCGLLDDDSSGKCGEAVDDKIPYKYPVTKSELVNGAGPYFKCTYQTGDSGSSFEFYKDYYECRCVEDEFGYDLLTEVHGWVPRDMTDNGKIELSGFYDLGGKFTSYSFQGSGAETNRIHLYGQNGWIDINEEDKCSPLKSTIKVYFDKQGSKEADINYLVDSVKLQLYFQVKYAKPK